MRKLYLIILSNIFIVCIMMGAYFILELRSSSLERQLYELSQPYSSIPCTIPPYIHDLANLTNVCKWELKGYKSSKWEQLWVDNIHDNYIEYHLMREIY